MSLLPLFIVPMSYHCRVTRGKGKRVEAFVAIFYVPAPLSLSRFQMVYIYNNLRQTQLNAASNRATELNQV